MTEIITDDGVTVRVIADTIIKAHRVVICASSRFDGIYFGHSTNDSVLMRGPVEDVLKTEPKQRGDAEGMIRYLAHAGTDRDAWKY